MDHSHTANSGESHGSAGGYTAGFILSVLLTAAAFGLVMTGTLTGHSALLAISGLAFVQIIVHLVFFLHMKASQEQKWNVLAFGFTVLTVVIVIIGTLWVMHNVSMNMMSR